ncbi:hypothetical protein [Microbacterium sp. LWH3-1.2]|uniref:hypothetical protein n=1 Tax=Microbacterium sp. LWH3-1.2 TaxID=3135256 RepID=UPI003431B50C
MTDDQARAPQDHPAEGVPPAPAGPAPGGGQPTPLVLSATPEGGTATVAPKPLTDLPPGKKVTFVVAHPSPIPVPALFAGTQKLDSVNFTNDASAATSTTWQATTSFTEAPEHDLYASVTVGTVIHRSPPIRVALASTAPAPPAENPPGAPAEIQIGEYDPEFAKWTGGVFRALAFVVLALGGWIILWTLPMGGSGCCTEVDFQERIIAAGSVLALVAGAVAVLMGVWLSVLEVRGRQRARALLAAETTRGGIGLPIQDIEKLAAALSKVRGTIAAYVVGVILIVLGLGGLLGGDALVSSGATTPDPAVSTPAPRD